MNKKKLFLGIFLILVGIGTLPSVYLLASGLMSGQYDNGAYFIAKLSVYALLTIVLLGFGVRFLRRSRNVEDSEE